MAFGITALAGDRGIQMKAGYLRVTVALWIVALVAGGYAESYPNRPTASEMDEIVEQGTACVLGVNERCQATQYATNPVSYQVSPPFVKTNDAGWYLDQNAMGAMASTIRALVPHYVDVNTVYDGTTNIAMLTVGGVWAELEIGDHINQFTCTPEVGTNAATYGDAPWRIYGANVEERYKVLEALGTTKVSILTDPTIKDGSGNNTIAEYNSTLTENTNSWSDAIITLGEAAWQNNRYFSSMGPASMTFGYKKSDTHWYVSPRFVFTRYMTPALWTNEHRVSFYLHGDCWYGSYSDSPLFATNNGAFATYYDEFGNGIVQNTIKSYFETTTASSVSYTPILPHDSTSFPSGYPSWPNTPTVLNQWYAKGQWINIDYIIVQWDATLNGFQYCTEEY